MRDNRAVSTDLFNATLLTLVLFVVVYWALVV